MARKSNASQTDGKQSTRNSAAKQQGAARKLKNDPAPSYEDNRIFDDRVRRDIIGIVLIMLAAAMLIAALLPSDGIITAFVSDALFLVFGIGAFLVPVFFAAIGVTFLFRFQKERVPLRVGIGLAVILVAILGLIGLATPTEAVDYSDLFIYDSLISHGGYIGAGIAWAGYTLFGKAVSYVILIGVIILGFVVIGFSISRFIEKVREKSLTEVIENARIAREEKRNSRDLDRAPSARIKRGRSSASSPASMPQGEADAVGEGDTPSPSAKTSVLGAAKSRKRPKHGAQASQIDESGASQGAATQLLNEQEDSAESHAEPATLTRKLSKKPAGSSPSRKAAKPLVPEIEIPLEGQDGFVLPPMSLLATHKGARGGATEAELSETSARLQETLEDFGIMAQVVVWVAGPTVTLFKVDLPAGVRVSRITALNDDIALALAAPGVRIFAPIPGTNYVGIEVPNRARQTVLLSDVLADAQAGPLQIAIGKDVEGHSVVSDLAKMPHLLIGGTTGSGKSVSINAMIMSILMRATPSEVRFIMIDPKRVEFTPYNGIPHLYVPVVTEAKEAASALSWGVAEMERRLKVFSKVGARNIGQYNARVESGELGEEDKLPYIVIIIDELADLMMNVGKEVEFSISRIAQLARAAGIHLIVATQRPSTNVVTGLIKANITNRIAFNVASGIDSRVILDTPGAENLIGLGDLLLSKPELAKPQRIQGCYVSEDEINAVVDMLKKQGEPEYHSEILSTNLITLGASNPDGSGGSCGVDDPLLWEAAGIVVQSGLGSTSNIQRRLKVGYSRAGRIMDQLEEKGVVGPANGSKPREVLVDELELETLKAFEANDSDNDDYCF